MRKVLEARTGRLLFRTLALVLLVFPVGAVFCQGKKIFQVIIIMDVQQAWAKGVQEGFMETLDAQLAAAGATAAYQVFTTNMDPKTIAPIQAAIDSTKPDLICTINHPAVFVDNYITKNPINSRYRFVSENCVPLQSGLIADTGKPGGNVTGVGVFVQMNSLLRLARMINPKVKKLAIFTWDKIPLANDWFEAEFQRACKEEGFELVEFRRVSFMEDALDFLLEYDKKGRDYFVSNGIGNVMIQRNGQVADVKAASMASRPLLKNLLYLGYDEETVKASGIMTGGTVVIWQDIGAQLAEKGFKILEGAKPGDLPWDYPRKYSLIVNTKVAQDMGYSLPSNLLSAAYRVYTDLQGSYAGQAK